MKGQGFFGWLILGLIFVPMIIDGVNQKEKYLSEIDGLNRNLTFEKEVVLNENDTITKLLAHDNVTFYNLCMKVLENYSINVTQGFSENITCSVIKRESNGECFGLS